MLLIALDSCPGALVESMCDAGTLPNLERLRRRGVWGGVHSDAARFSGSVWPSFLTVSDVSHHGVYHWLQWDPDTARFRLPGPDWCPAPPFWEPLAAEGMPVISLDVPFARVRRDLPNSAAVLGWGTNEAIWHESTPAGLLAELEGRFGRSAQAREVPGPRPNAAFRADLERHTQDVVTRTSIVEHLAGRFPWRLLIACFSETHYAGHWHWSDRATGEQQGGLRRVLRTFDSVLPRLEGLLSADDHMAVFSGHGMGPKPDLERFAEPLARYIEPGRLSSLGLTDPVSLLRRLLPAGVRRLLAHGLPPEAYNNLVNRYANARTHRNMRTIVNTGDDALYVTANVPDRSENDRHLAAVVSKLEELGDDAGGPLLGIDRPSQIYSGPRLRLLPDLVLRRPAPAGTTEAMVLPDGRRIAGRKASWQDGGHTSGGFYLQIGPGIAAGGRGRDIDIHALAPVLCGPAGIDALRTV